MRREYGALDGDADPPGPSSSSGGGGWPSWWRLRRQRGGALGGFASFFGGTRESVSVANCLMEMQAAVVVSACVATLSAGLFHRDPAVKVDPSLPWSAQGSHAGANSPTFVSLVHVMAHGGYVLAAPVVGVGVELLGFPVVTALAAALCPLVASGYAAVDFTAVSRGLVRARLLAGAWKATHELSTASGNAVAFTPAASAQAFGRQAAVWSVVSVAAPFAISLLVPTLGVPGVFIALSATGFVVFCAATILVLTPWMAAGGDLPPRAPCLNVLSEEEDGDGDVTPSTTPVNADVALTSNCGTTSDDASLLCNRALNACDNTYTGKGNFVSKCRTTVLFFLAAVASSRAGAFVVVPSAANISFALSVATVALVFSPSLMVTKPMAVTSSAAMFWCGGRKAWTRQD